MGSRNKHANCRQSNPRKAPNSQAPFGMLRLDGALDTIPMHDRYFSHQKASIIDSHVCNQSFGQRNDLEEWGCQNVSLRYPKRYRATAVQNGAVALEHARLFPTYKPNPSNSHTFCELNSVIIRLQFNPNQREGISTQIPFHITALTCSNHQYRLLSHHSRRSNVPPRWRLLYPEQVSWVN